MNQNLIKTLFTTTTCSIAKSRTLLLAIIFLLTTGSSDAATFIVSNLNSTGTGSLAAAITSANSTAGLDDIDFSIAGVIVLTSPLPTITEAVNINGQTAPGYTILPVVILNGQFAGTTSGLTFNGVTSGSVDALTIQSFTNNGIRLNNSDNVTITRCMIGLNITGTAASANSDHGILAENGSDNTTIGGSGLGVGNIISGNSDMGIRFDGSSNGVISQNVIGLDLLGTTAIPNLTGGLEITNSSNNTQIGGSSTLERNLITGNGNVLTGNGIDISNSTGTIIRGNYIGLDVTGSIGIGNQENGISLFQAANTTIGGTGANDGNVISAHNFNAIVMNNASNNCDVFGNLIGTDATGNTALGNDLSGIIVVTSTGNTIGGNTAAHRNIFSNSISENGIYLISSSNNVIQGNCIGTDVTGTMDMGNFGGGIRLDFFSTNNTIGGYATNEGNLIAFNGTYGIGVLCSGCAQNLVSMNEIFCNTGKGIDLNASGNSNYPAPTISNFTITGASGAANPGDTIQLYYDSTCTAFCQGKVFVAEVVTNPLGVWTYNAVMDPNQTLAAIAISPFPFCQ